MSLDDTKKVRATFILEVIGKPPEHLTETLQGLIKNIEAEKGVKIINKKFNEPVALKDNPEFFTSFAEVEIEVEEVLTVAILMFKYMPAHIEIMEPEFIGMSNNDLGEVLNELTRRLHGYDEIARVTQVEKSILEKKLKALMENSKNPEEEKK